MIVSAGSLVIARNNAPRLLVVDDNADNRDLLVRRLQRLGHKTVDTAPDGQAALDLIRSQVAKGLPYDVVLLDVMMPRLNGVQVLEAMAADPSLAGSSVIMISAATEIDTVVRCIELGAEDYLPKPFNPVLLRARLATVLEKKRLRDEVARQLRRLELELADARAQQLAMVPTDFPLPGDGLPGVVHAIMIPAREVGGDLYDCFAVAPGIVCVAVGDVAGKGMPAALFMARARSLLRASALQHVATTGAPPLPGELAWVLNEELCKNNALCMFVTMFLGFIDMATGVMDFFNAGHVRPLLLSPNGMVSEIASKPALPLGIAAGRRYANHQALLPPQETLVLLTDGLPEMTDPDGHFYTVERLQADLAALAGAEVATITATLVSRVQAFAAGAPAADDVTVLALRRF